MEAGHVCFAEFEARQGCRFEDEVDRLITTGAPIVVTGGSSWSGVTRSWYAGPCLELGCQ